jgi:hypothetical protein
MYGLRILAGNFYVPYKCTCKITVPLILAAALNWEQTVKGIISKPITNNAIIIATVITTRKAYTDHIMRKQSSKYSI